MRDLAQAEDLDIDTSDMVVVTHPDKKARYGGGPAEFTMTRLAFVKRDLGSRGYQIVGEAATSARPTGREQALMDEVEDLRRQLEENQGEDRKTELLAEADALGVKVHPNAKLATIEKKIAEARAALEADDFGDDDPE